MNALSKYFNAFNASDMNKNGSVNLEIKFNLKSSSGTAFNHLLIKCFSTKFESLNKMRAIRNRISVITHWTRTLDQNCFFTRSMI